MLIRVRRALSAGVLCTALALPTSAKATSAPTIYDNYQSFPVGSRAAGMGGAYTALACDEGALHYNPAALACSSASRLELTANAYVLHRYHVPSAFGAGEDISATTYHSLPSIVGAVRILSNGEEPQAGWTLRPGRLAVGFSVSVPNSIALQIDPAHPKKRNFMAISVRDALNAADIGIAYQMNRLLAVGLSLGAAVRIYEEHRSALIVSSASSPCGSAADVQDCNEYVSFLDDTNVFAAGARAKLGLRLTPTPELSLGLVFTSPALDVYGKAESSSTVSVALSTSDAQGVIYGSEPTRLHGSSEVGTPFRIAVGAAYATPRFTASLDLSVNMPRRVRMGHDMTAEPIEGVQPPTEDDLADWVLTYGAQPNVNLGVELGVTRDIVFDLGAFTDLSGVSDDDRKNRSVDRIHMFGGSAAVGLLGKQARGWFGLSFEYGQADSKVPSATLTLDNVRNGLRDDALSTATRWTFVGIIGSNYSFMASN